MLNPNFGTNVPSYRPDSDWVNGWGKRPYNWQTSVSVDREILPYLVVNAGYYRTWYGNFMVIDNQSVAPEDFSPYCVTVPTDSRLPLSGQQLCGLYDLNPNRVGQIDNLVTLAKNYGEHKEVYNGVDVNFQLRLKARATLGGGWNIGNAVQLGTTAGGTASASTNSCYVVDSPQQLFNCDVKVPYQSRIKLNGSYTLPWRHADRGRHSEQSRRELHRQPGVHDGARSSRRSDARCRGPRRSPFHSRSRIRCPVRASTSSICVAPRSSASATTRLQANVDAYNLFNMNTPVTLFGTYNARWGQPTQVLDGRLVKFSAQFRFLDELVRERRVFKETKTRRE